MTLPAIEAMRALSAPHEVRRFDPALDAADAATALGLPLDALLDTLAVASMQGVTLCCLGADRRLDLERLGDSRSALIGPGALPRMTGFTPGAATPIAGPGGRRFPVLLDEAAMAHRVVGVGAGEAGVELLLSPGDLVRATAARVQALAVG